MVNLATIKFAVSFKRELLIIFGTLAFILLMPLIAVVVIANAGVSAISSTMVVDNLQTKQVQIYDPNGHLVTTLSITDTWPVAGVVTLEFGASDYPFQDHHTGIDIADSMGSIGRPVTTFMAGTVSKVMNVDNKYGRYVFVDHGNHVESQYWHLSRATVTVGQKVTPGDVIGLEGETGLATGPHVHFQIDVYGIPVNPRMFISGNPPLR